MRKPFLFLIVFLACVCLPAATFGAWYGLGLRPQPRAVEETLFQGVSYLRSARSAPRPQVIHVIKIDLRTNGIETLVTPGERQAELPVQASTTSEFLEAQNLQVAINGDGFTPWYNNGPLDYYPRSGERVDPIGLAASRGTVYSEVRDNEPVLYLARTNRARFNTPAGRIHNAISGTAMILERGRVIPGLEESLQPRSAVGLDQRGRFLYLVVVDGRQPGYSEGATLPELAQILLEQGAYSAMNLDGGGSTTLVAAKNGRANVLNSPINHRIPGLERPVGSHLGIFARPLE